MNKTQRISTTDTDTEANALPEASAMPLGRLNFIAMGVAAVLIVLGFILMLGGGSTPEAFNADIFSTRRIVVGPAIAFVGFVAMAVAIIVKPKAKA